jgi:integrase
MLRISRARGDRKNIGVGNGLDIKTTSSVLGHASPGVTLAIYGHLLEGGMRVATDRLGARLEKIRDAG